MLPQDKLENVRTGDGYVVGRVATHIPELRHINEGAIAATFDGLDTALDYITKELPTPRSSMYDSSIRTGRPGGFNLFESYDEAMDIFRNRPEEVVNFDPTELRIKDNNEAGSSVEYDVTGDFIDMGRFMEGIPESVGTMRGGDSRNRRVNIIINLSQAAGIDGDIITHRGERILRLIDALEGGGVRCMLTAVQSNELVYTEIVLKHHAEPLTITDLAVVTHSEFLRRPLFRIIEHSDICESGYGNSLIFGNTITPSTLEPENNDEVAVFIDGGFSAKPRIDERFDQAERLLTWELSKPVPEVTAIKVTRDGVFFQPNGARSNEEIRREGQEAINAK